jgi:hypothetical protein
MSHSKKIVQALEHISVMILLIRGDKVMLDRDMAELSGVETKRKKEAVRRNIKWFAADFILEILKIMKQNT